MPSYEIEIKSLLVAAEKAEALQARMRELDPALAQLGKNTQLNHYFIGGNLESLAPAVLPLLDDEAREKFVHIVREGRDVSVRTRKHNAKVLLVAKASVDATTSANGITRIEFEAVLPLSLDELDQLVQDAGFKYQAKWSREREEYVCRGINVCLDKNAGYGYVAEFEKVIEDEQSAEAAQEELRALMQTLGVEELPQDRLERMFAYYNEHWPEYYGTDRVFVVF